MKMNTEAGILRRRIIIFAYIFIGIYFLVIAGQYLYLWNFKIPSALAAYGLKEADFIESVECSRSMLINTLLIPLWKMALISITLICGYPASAWNSLCQGGVLGQYKPFTKSIIFLITFIPIILLGSIFDSNVLTRDAVGVQFLTNRINDLPRGAMEIGTRWLMQSAFASIGASFPITTMILLTGVDILITGIRREAIFGSVKEQLNLPLNGKTEGVFKMAKKYNFPSNRLYLELGDSAFYYGTVLDEAIILQEDLLDKPVDQIEAVVAHELGHSQQKDRYFKLLGNRSLHGIASSFIYLFIALPNQDTLPAAFHFNTEPLVASIVISNILTQLFDIIWNTTSNLLDLWKEWDADQFAKQEGYGLSLAKYLAINGWPSVSSLPYTLLFHTHPSTLQRTQYLTSN